MRDVVRQTRRNTLHACKLRELTYSLGEGGASLRGAGASGRTCVLQAWMAMHYDSESPMLANFPMRVRWFQESAKRRSISQGSIRVPIVVWGPAAWAGYSPRMPLQ